MNLQGTIGMIAIGCALLIFFPFLFVPLVILVVVNLICKASEAQDKRARERASLPHPQGVEPLSAPFIAERPEDVF